MNALIQTYNTIKDIVISNSFLQSISSVDTAIVNNIIYQSLFEAQWALRFLSKFDCKEKLVLEIGSGAGIVSACLHLTGAQVTMVEPSSGAFSFQEKICAALHEHLGIRIPCINKPVENLQQLKPQYDFIFSINVLEHIRDLRKAFTVMSCLIKDDGVMFHVCPNYTVPYEPHVGVLLVPFFPRATYALSKRLRTHPVSQELTFITVGTIKKLAKNNNLAVEFYKDMMYQSFMRLETDNIFRQRQSGLPYMAFKALKTFKILHITKYIPVCMQTPIAFEMKKNKL